MNSLIYEELRQQFLPYSCCVVFKNQLYGDIHICCINNLKNFNNELIRYVEKKECWEDEPIEVFVVPRPQESSNFMTINLIELLIPIIQNQDAIFLYLMLISLKMVNGFILDAYRELLLEYSISQADIGNQLTKKNIFGISEIIKIPFKHMLTLAYWNLLLSQKNTYNNKIKPLLDGLYEHIKILITEIEQRSSIYGDGNISYYFFIRAVYRESKKYNRFNLYIKDKKITEAFSMTTLLLFFIYKKNISDHRRTYIYENRPRKFITNVRNDWRHVQRNNSSIQHMMQDNYLTGLVAELESCIDLHREIIQLTLSNGFFRFGKIRNSYEYDIMLDLNLVSYRDIDELNPHNIDFFPFNLHKEYRLKRCEVNLTKPNKRIIFKNKVKFWRSSLDDKSENLQERFDRIISPVSNV